MKVDAAVLHALIQGCQVDTGMGHGIAEQHQVERAAGGAGGVPDLEKPRAVRAGEIDGLTGGRHRRIAGGGKNGDFAVFNKEFNSAFPFHNPSVRHSLRLSKALNEPLGLVEQNRDHSDPMGDVQGVGFSWKSTLWKSAFGYTQGGFAVVLVLTSGTVFHSDDTICAQLCGPCPQSRSQELSIFINSDKSLNNNVLIRFEGFELDTKARTLKRQGTTVPIKPKTFELLLYLAEHAQQEVSREELLSAVWPSSFVEERNLSQHVFLLRKALAASGESESIIATIPGRGYQFRVPVVLVPVERVGSDPPTQPDTPAASGDHLVVRAEQSITRVVIAEEDGASDGRRPWWWIGSVAAVVALGVVGWLAWSRSHSNQGSHVQVVIADFENSTGDTTFDHTLNKVVQIDLQQSPYFTVVGEGRLRHVLSLMGRKADAPISEDDVREACQRLNAQVYLIPAIAAIGNRYLITISANTCSDGSLVGARKQDADSKADVLRAVEEATSQIRKTVGESRASLKQFNRPLYLMRTSSLEALQAYSRAVAFAGAGKADEAARLYQRAVELDPNFATAYLDLSSQYFNLGDSKRDKEAISKAYALRDTVNDRERLFIVFRYNESVTGDLQAMNDTLRLGVATYPSDNLLATDLANHMTWIGQYPESAAMARHSLELNAALGIPPNGVALEIAARAFKHMGQYDTALKYYNIGVQAKNDSAAIHGLALQIAALRHDQKGVDEQITWSRGTSAEMPILQQAAMAALAEGRARDSDRLFTEAAAAARRDHAEADMGVIDAYRTRILFDAGLTAEAKSLSEAFTGEDIYMDRLYTMAEVGDAARARAIAVERQKESPQDTLVNVEYAPSVYAALALRAGKPAEAVEQMRAAEAYELRDPTIAYARGQAFLAARDFPQAEAQFRILIDNPGIDDPLTPLHALAHLNLGRALALEGKRPEAKAEYAQFLEMWKSADADLPPLKQAREEMARLEQK